ncbi:MAG TPA: hypothetical protein VKU01_06610 [Bryobacteraceae bacterium]|nr:hypothetical protein [Bryobacteraceae bacterium]
MSNGLTVTLKLDSAECVRQESARFEVSVTNNSRETLEELATLVSKNLVLRVVLESDLGQRTANQRSGVRRDGQTYHAPDTPEVTNLAPGQSMTAPGDLLDWFGLINPGEYRVKAVYIRSGEPIESASQTLRVHPAKPVTAASPRSGERARSAPLINAWVNDAGGTHTLFLQENSPALPSNPRHCQRLPGNFNAQHLDAAQQPLSGLPVGHLTWSAGPAAIGVASMPFEKPRAASLESVPAPFPGHPLRSPLSTQEGTVWIPYADAQLTRFAAVHVEKGAAKSVELKLGSLATIGPYVNIWDYDANLYFAWGAKQGNEVRCGRLGLRPAGTSFAPIFAQAFDAPVVWLDGYIQIHDDDSREPILWVVRRKAGALACCRFRSTSKIWLSDALLVTDKMPNLEPISSVVTAGKQLGLLLKSPDGDLYYGSTTTGTIVPVPELVRKEIKASQSPGLLASDDNGIAFWVHLRYLEPDHIATVRLEPLKESDPMDRI